MLKNRLILFLIGIIIIFLLMLIHQYNRTQEFKKQSEDRAAIMNQTVREWRTKNGKLVHENSVIKLQSDKVAKEVFKQDSLLKELNIKWNKVHTVSKTTVENHYRITTPVTKTDTTIKLQEWSNGYLTVNGEIDLQKNIASLDYQHRDTIFQVIHYKRSKKFLNLIPYGKFNFVSQTTTADSLTKVVEQITYIKQK